MHTNSCRILHNQVYLGKEFDHGQNEVMVEVKIVMIHLGWKQELAVRRLSAVVMELL